MNQDTLSMHDFAHLDMNQCINTLVYGTTVQMIRNKKKNKNKKPGIFVFSLCENDFHSLQWFYKFKNKKNVEKIDLGMISSVSHFNSPSDEKKPMKYDKKLILEIMYGRNQKLALLFNDYHTKELFWCGLNHFMDKFHAEEVAMYSKY